VLIALLLSLGVGGPAKSAALRIPPRRTPLVVVVRRLGLKPYEQVAEELRSRVRAVVRMAPARKGARKGLLDWLRKIRPDLTLAIGQRAYDMLRDARLSPMIYTYVFHRQRISHRGVPVRVPPKRAIDALLAARPGLRRAAVLCSPSTLWLVEAARTLAKRRKLLLIPLVARSPAAALSALRTLDHRIKALWMIADLNVLSRQVLQYAIGLQFRRRMPLLAASRSHIAAGALCSVDYDPIVLGQRAARLATSILAKRRPRRRRRRKDGRATLRIGASPYGGDATRLTANGGTALRIGADLARLRAAGAEVVH